MQQGTIKQLANLMRDMKMANEPPYVLILGAGASVSSGAPQMSHLIHQCIQDCAPEKAGKLTGEAEWVEEFYRIIESEDRPDARDMKFRKVFLPERFGGQPLRPSYGYKALAELVKDRWFDLILTFNVDPFLERALRDEGLNVGTSIDDAVILIDPHLLQGEALETLLGRHDRIRVVKLHGDVGNGTYRFNPRDTFEFSPPVKIFVGNSLYERGAVIVGSSMGDLDLLRAIRRGKRAVWYVNPVNPQENPSARTVLRAMSCSYICNGEGDFDRFFSALRAYVQTPSGGILSSVGFLNRIIELKEVKDRLLLPRYPPVTVISGPMGYGKTYFMDELARDLRRGEWNCVATIKCEEVATKQNVATVRNVLASECGCGIVADWEEISAYLGLQISSQQQKQYKVALLVDGIDWLAENTRYQLLAGLHIIHKGISNAGGECRVVLSGRCIKRDLENVTKAIRAKRILPFGQPGPWYSEVPLSEFDQDVISDLINRVSHGSFTLEEYLSMTDALLEITGGHPKGLVRIVTEDLHRRRGWTFDKRPGTAGFYFNSETNERLFAEYMSDVVAEIKDKIGKWWEDFQAVCVLREFNADKLQRLIDKGAIRSFSKGTELFTWLLTQGLVREKKPGFWGDAIARDVVLAELKMLSTNRKRYGALNELAAGTYTESLDRICGDYEKTHTPELESYLVAYAVELVYHHVQATKYPEPSTVRHKNPLDKILEEVGGRVKPLGPDITQQLSMEITKDREICPSPRERTLAVRYFSSLSR